MRPEGLCRWKIPVTLSGMGGGGGGHALVLLVEALFNKPEGRGCLNQLRHCILHTTDKYLPMILTDMFFLDPQHTGVTTYQTLQIQLLQNAPDDGPMRSETCRAKLKC